MEIFCTKCGTKNEAGAAFCDNCGAPLKMSVTLQGAGDSSSFITLNLDPIQPKIDAEKGAASGAKQNAVFISKKMIYIGASFCVLLVVGGAGLYFMLQPPEANSSNLLAAAKAGYGKAIPEPVKRSLCLGNMAYRDSKLNISEYDQRSQNWLNTLVVAGLYSPPVNIASEGYFSRNQVEYAATPELAKYLDGGRLCVGKDVEIADVVDIAKPVEEALEDDTSSKKFLTVKAVLTLQATGIAPWLEKAEVRDQVLPALNGWQYKDKKLQVRMEETFVLRNRQWITGPVYQAVISKEYETAQESNERTKNSSQKVASTGFASMLSGFFNFGGHPLKGTWQKKSPNTSNFFGMNIPTGAGGEGQMIFTTNTLEVAGRIIKCKFEVDGKQVKVIPEGDPQNLLFVMLDKDTAVLDMGFVKTQFKRVK